MVLVNVGVFDVSQQRPIRLIRIVPFVAFSIGGPHVGHVDFRFRTAGPKVEGLVLAFSTVVAADALFVENRLDQFRKPELLHIPRRRLDFGSGSPHS